MMPASTSKSGLLVICGWLCATVGLPAGVLCQEADGRASFEVACESVCDNASADHASHETGALGPRSSDCSDTPIGLDATRPGSGRDHLTPILSLRPAPLTPEPIAADPLPRLARADDVEQPRAGPIAVHLPSILLLI